MRLTLILSAMLSLARHRRACAARRLRPAAAPDVARADAIGQTKNTRTSLAAGVGCAGRWKGNLHPHPGAADGIDRWRVAM